MILSAGIISFLIVIIYYPLRKITQINGNKIFKVFKSDYYKNEVKSSFVSDGICTHVKTVSKFGTLITKLEPFSPLGYYELIYSDYDLKNLNIDEVDFQIFYCKVHNFIIEIK